MKFFCTSCGFVFNRKGDRAWFECPRCKGDAYWENSTLVNSKSGIFVKKYKDVTAFGFDKKTGQPLWLDRKGNKLRHDDPSVRYTTKGDPHGWESTGKIKKR